MPLPSPGVQYGGVQIQAVDFEVLGDPPEKPREDVPIQFEIATGDAHPKRLPVWFKCTVAMEGWYRVSVSYRMLLIRDEGSDTPWNLIVARLAPIVLYPFCRETIASLLLKAGITTPPPPIVDFGQLFSPDELAIPEEAVPF